MSVWSDISRLFIRSFFLWCVGLDEQTRAHREETSEVSYLSSVFMSQAVCENNQREAGECAYAINT